jgi:hypothetical protein
MKEVYLYEDEDRISNGDIHHELMLIADILVYN